MVREGMKVPWLDEETRELKQELQKMDFVFGLEDQFINSEKLRNLQKLVRKLRECDLRQTSEKQKKSNLYTKILSDLELINESNLRSLSEEIQGSLPQSLKKHRITMLKEELKRSEKRGQEQTKQKLIRNKFISMFIVKSETKSENWATSLGWFIPRKYRNDIIGDILEDCADMRKKGCIERRIKFHVMYQWLIGVITLVPTAVKTSIVDSVKQVISPPK